MAESKTIYPRVKVREDKEEDDEFLVEEDDSTVQEETYKCSLPLFRILESVSLLERSVSGMSSVINSGDKACSILLPAFSNVSNHKQLCARKESQNDSSPSVARIPDEAKTSISTSKGVKNNKKIDEETRIRASSVPRPRAVVSSPDNDWMIGSRNRPTRERSSNLKKNNLGQKSPVQVKDKCIRAAGSLSTRKVSDESSERKSCLNEKKNPELKFPNQKAFLRKGKPGTLVV